MEKYKKKWRQLWIWTTRFWLIFCFGGLWLRQTAFTSLDSINLSHEFVICFPCCEGSFNHKSTFPIFQFYSSVDSSARTILLPRVRVLCTPSTLLTFIVFVLYLSTEKNKYKQHFGLSVCCYRWNFGDEVFSFKSSKVLIIISIGWMRNEWMKEGLRAKHQSLSSLKQMLYTFSL